MGKSNHNTKKTCLRCGQCCILLSKSGRPLCKCPYLKVLKNGKTKCSIYEKRLGKRLPFGNVCYKRSAVPFGYVGCPYNDGKPVRNNKKFL